MLQELSRKSAIVALSVLITFSSFAARAQDMNQLLGGALGAAIGGQKGNTGDAIAGAIIGVAMATILQQLSEAEKAKRENALQAAAKSGKANWSTSGSNGKKATYKKVGAAESIGGKNCQKVQETITLPDGKQGTSTETVCFNS
jgi:hypothetical protein